MTYTQTLRRGATVVLFAGSVLARPAVAQENYEIQVYASPTMEKQTTMWELHSNFTLQGRKTVVSGVNPTNHAIHETLEITHGFNDWFETGFYLFTAARPGDGFQLVGSHIRPRFRVPETWKWPVGVSISQEIGYQRTMFDENSWSWEIRPIIDRQFGAFFFDVNPAIEKAIHGPSATEGWEFNPNIAATVDVNKKVNLGVEYYGGWGPLKDLLPNKDRGHQIYGVINLNLRDDFEFNFGFGSEVGAAHEKHIIKLILGRQVKGWR
jgi:hypothetical protein